MSSRRRRELGLLAAVVALALGALAVVIVVRRASGGDALPDDVGVVEYVVDGDTVDIVIGGTEERVRLIGINTPEIAHPDSPADCFGPEAAAFTADLLPVGAEVRLERDVVGRDDYGRLLAYVFRRSDDLFVNEAIAANGFARPLTIAPNDAYAERFVDAATAAHAADLGLWAACAG